MNWRIFVLAVLLSLAFPSLAFATTQSIVVNGYVPTQIVMNQPFDVPIKLSCSGCGDSYIRIVLFPTSADTSADYFGATLNNSGVWADRTYDVDQFFHISSTDLNNGVWTATMSAKADRLGSYTGPGPNYQIKVIRYTPSGSVAVASSAQPIYILDTNYQTPTPIPSVTPTPTPSATPTTTPTPIATPTPTPTPKPTTPTPSPTASPSLDPTAEGYDILGTSSANADTSSDPPTSDPTLLNTNASNSGQLSKVGPAWFAWGAIGLGALSILSLGSYLCYDWYRCKRVKGKDV